MFGFTVIYYSIFLSDCREPNLNMYFSRNHKNPIVSTIYRYTDNLFAVKNFRSIIRNQYMLKELVDVQIKE